MFFLSLIFGGWSVIIMEELSMFSNPKTDKVLILNTVLLAIGLNNFKRWKQTSEEIKDECHTKYLV